MGSFPDFEDKNPNGSPRFKKEIGMVTAVFREEEYGTYRCVVLIRGMLKFAFNYQLTLLESE